MADVILQLFAGILQELPHTCQQLTKDFRRRTLTHDGSIRLWDGACGHCGNSRAFLQAQAGLSDKML
jgi:hypothetical protein